MERQTRCEGESPCHPSKTLNKSWAGWGGRGGSHTPLLHGLHSLLLSAGDPVQERPPSIPLPSPSITFHLWTGKEQLWKELVLFLRPRSQLRLSTDLEVLDLQGIRPDRELARVSVLSTDSGIERDLPLGADELPASSSPEIERAGLQRKGGIKKRVWPLDFLMPGSWDGPPGLHRRTGRPGGDGEVLPGVSRLHTARVLVLGDDRMLGRLAQAYHRLRKRETQKFCLTPRLSLQLYYIPVLAPEPAASRQPELGELAAFLGRVDPWYQSTINTLCPAIHKLAEMVGEGEVPRRERGRGMESGQRGGWKSPSGQRGWDGGDSRLSFRT
ncbi:phosphoinositide 3-kinase regulatory subunit 6-like isoform X2 [Sapajus apella]|uniref:Phosphoinositide 3-kinase regulatory subunit 6-like isoform X2 n=1 Tax=Sapajus apella TaxID=9515 RepID=A0A6J3HHH4_SAPAP|nr:phosphoinositide 3-kinase regulatory subunit 6-like isoform X2 [Sapajus apella]